MMKNWRGCSLAEMLMSEQHISKKGLRSEQKPQSLIGIIYKTKWNVLGYSNILVKHFIFTIMIYIFIYLLNHELCCLIF